MNYGQETVAAACMAAAAGVAHANETAQPLPADDTIVITATRMPIPSGRVIAPVEVIDNDTIERSMAVELSELLRFQAGLDVVRTGGPGQQTSVFTRGTNSNHTLVLIDGVRINTAGVGLAAVQNITPEMIERVEIVKAPRTTLYGENALGGVINVITKNPDAPTLSAFGGAGQDATVKLGIAGGTRIGAFSGSARVQRLQTDGFEIVEGAGFDSGWDNTTVEAKLGYDTDRWGVQARLWSSEGTTEYVTFPVLPASQDYENSIVAIAGRARITDSWESLLDLSFNVDDLQQQQSDDFAKTERTILDWQNTVTIGRVQTVVAGAFLSREDVDGASFGFPIAEDVDAVAVYAEDTLDFGRNVFVLAGRLSDHDAIGKDFTWNVEYGFDLSDAMRLTANAGRAVRAPSVSERFGPFGGNPDLREEDATTLQAGWQWGFAAAHELRVDVYHTRIENLIASDANFQLQNIDEAEITGLEAGYRFAAANWNVRVTGRLQNPENKSTGTTLLRRSEESATLSVVRDIGRHQVGADLQLVGSRSDFGDQNLAGYGLMNLTGKFAIGADWSVNARVENLFDRDYTPAYYDFDVRYRGAGRGAYVELRYTLN
ncbi:MAG: TonB-dependent receptor plug domain-containing protein [Gammaproteobacteria bacterium]